MIKFYLEKNGKIEENEFHDTDTVIEKNSWIRMISPTSEDVKRICRITGLEEKRMLDALDPEETAHVDFDGDNLITLDVPVWKDGNCETVPYIIMYNTNYYVTLCNEEASVTELLLSKTRKIDLKKRNRLSIQIMYRIATMYITALGKLDVRTEELEKKIRTSTKNKEIFELMDLNKSMIYLSTSLNSNKNAIVKLQKIAEFRKYEEDNDLLDDVIIENNQAMEMCQIHREILDSMMSAFASVTSNNLNIIMKLLAIITLVISLPTLLASIYGMNVKGLPFADAEGAFWIILAIAIVFATVGAFILVKSVNYSIKMKKNN